jgi:hypothetical protein
LSTENPDAANPETYCAEFFDLQLGFAAKVAELSGQPLTETVGSHTNIYVRLAMGPQLDRKNPAWIEYISALAVVPDPAAWTHEVHLRRAHLPAGPTRAGSAGLFSYAVLGPGRVRLHFHAGREVAESPLSRASEHLRKRELASLLSQVASLGPETQVVGASWLYNLDAYRRLFPKPYLDCLRPISHPYQRMPLWGQFLHRDRTVRKEAAQALRSQLSHVTSQVELSSCFPLPVLAATVPVTWLLQ